MTIRDVLTPSLVVAGMAAAVAAGQNQVQIMGGTARTDVAPVQSAAPPAPGAPAAPVAASDVTNSVSFSGRVGFGDSSRLLLNRTVGGAYVSDFVVVNPECSGQHVSFSVQLVDRHRERLEVSATVTRVERNPEPSATPNDGETRPEDGRWLLLPGEADLFRLTIAGTEQRNRGEIPPGSPSLAWAALRSAPIDYGYWTGHLPSSGVLLLTRHSAPGEIKSENNVPRCVTGPALVARTARPLVLEPPLPSGLDTGVIVTSLILASAVALICAALVSRSSTNFWDPMPAAPFDVKNSWGANLAVGGGLITALMTTAILSSDRYSSSSASYTVLAALFAALVPLGSTLYGLSRPASGATQGDGYVVSFLGTTLIVLWGAFGQLLLIGMFFRELELASVLSPVSAGILIVTTKLVMVSLAIYAVIGSLGTIAAGTAKPAVQSHEDNAAPRDVKPLPPLTDNRRPAAMI